MSPAAVTSAPRPASRRATAAGRAAGTRRATGSRRAIVPPLPRRLSGPVGGRAHAANQPNVTLGQRALAVVRSLPDRSLIDRLVRGRAWIPVLGVLLAGLVAMQVEILKLGTNIGRSIERSTTLQGQNESLQAGVAMLADDQRIERLAGGMGMTMPSPSSEVFVAANGANAVGRALENIHAADPTNFAAQLAAQAAAAAMIAPAATGAAGTTGTASATGAPAATGAAGTTGTASATGTAATPAAGATSTPVAPASLAATAGPASTSSGTATATSQPAAAGAGTTGTTTGTAQAAASPAPGPSSAPSSGAAPTTAAGGAAALAPTQSGTPSGG